MNKIFSALLLSMSVLFTACEYDNYDAPEITFSGNLVYQGKNIQYDCESRLLLKVVQSGYGKVDGGTPVKINANGHFTHLLFEGDYAFMPYNNVYPFLIPDFPYIGGGDGYAPINITLNGDYNKDLEVIPYYQLSDFTASYDAATQTIVMKVHVEPVNDNRITSRPAVKNTRGYISTSVLVNSTTTCATTATADIPTGSGDVIATISLTDYQNRYTNNFRDYGYCRMAIELENIPNYYLFTNVVKVEDLPVKNWDGGK